MEVLILSGLITIAIALGAAFVLWAIVVHEEIASTVALVVALSALIATIFWAVKNAIG